MPENLLCPRCNKHFNDKVSEARDKGDIVVMTRIEYAQAVGKKTLERLKSELQKMVPARESLMEKAKMQLRHELVAEGTITIDPVEWRRRLNRVFEGLVGGKETADNMLGLGESHAERICSLRNFLDDISEKLRKGEGSDESEKETAAAA